MTMAKEAIELETLLDRAGRLVLPKPLRDLMGLRPGTKFEIYERNGEIRLVPIPEEPTLEKKDGVLVVTSGDPLPDEDWTQKMREARTSSQSTPFR